jgi:hypothetical protein
LRRKLKLTEEAIDESLFNVLPPAESLAQRGRAFVDNVELDKRDPEKRRNDDTLHDPK